jgi:8-amino-7-oxononanoate synthase
VADELSRLSPAQKRALLVEAARTKRAPIPAAHHRFAQFPEVLDLRARIAALDAWGVANPTFLVHEAPCGATTRIDGRELLNFYHYNYLGLARDPEVGTAAKAAIDRYGTSTGGSRLAAGELALHRELEAELAAFLGVEDAVVFLGGHAANESTIGHLLGPGDLILHDELAHNSILQGALLSGAEIQSFAHLDAADADRILHQRRRRARRVLVAIEGCYSAEGDTPDLDAFVALAERHQVNLFVDEAHSLGVLGASGRGICEHAGVDPRRVDICMGTLSKALGSAGGYIAGSAALIEYLRYTAPGFVYSVGMAPACAAAALAALRKLRAEPERVARLHANADLFRREALAHGLDIGPRPLAAVIPVYVRSARRCLRLIERLRERGVGAGPMVPPAVSEDSSRVRFFMSSIFTDAQIREAVAIVAEELDRLDD